MTFYHRGRMLDPPSHNSIYTYISNGESDLTFNLKRMSRCLNHLVKDKQGYNDQIFRYNLICL